MDGLDLTLKLRTQGLSLFADSVGNFFDVSGDSGFYGDAVAGDLVTTRRWRNNNTGSSTLGMTGEPRRRIATAGVVPEPSSAALLPDPFRAGRKRLVPTRPDHPR